ncbi:MAG TPA: hypothetical protein VKC66_23680 [Xanthobacteraceae bacterium]|nr:hypothetical protein [Hyphomicrobiaceae bacterium]HKD28893.1 hypothetical protein [Xanthobacteraceae bacterium]
MKDDRSVASCRTNAITSLMALLYICVVFSMSDFARAVTLEEVYGFSTDWVKDFFEKPDPQIERYFGIPSCTANPLCANTANDVLRRERSRWRSSPDRGKILVCLTYIIGSSIIRDNADLNWKIEYKDGFFLEANIGNESQVMEIFGQIANFDKPWFIFKEHGFDILLWKRLLKLHEIKPPAAKPPAIDIRIIEK